MTYAQGGLIQATDYNGFVASVNAIWGTGTLSKGYGQTSTTLPNVTAASDTVTAQQWTNLISKIDAISRHQTNALTGIASPSAGTVITYLSTVSSNIATLNTNRATAYATGTTSANSVGNTTVWVTSSIKETSVAFANANAMRYFFNAGGTITATVSDSTLSGNTKSTDWDTLLNNFGTCRISGTASLNTGSGYSFNTNVATLGFWTSGESGVGSSTGITNAYQVVGRMYSPTTTGGYKYNYVTSEVKLNANANLGTATTLSFKYTLTDAAADTYFPYWLPQADKVNGNVILTVTVAYPETTYLTQSPNPWGTVTFATVTDTQS